MARDSIKVVDALNSEGGLRVLLVELKQAHTSSRGNNMNPCN